MAKYKCPEGDFEQDMPGVCPKHPNMELEMVEMDEEKESMEGEEEEMKKDEDDEMEEE